MCWWIVAFAKLSSLLGIKNDLMELYCYAGMDVSLLSSVLGLILERISNAYHILIVCLLLVRYPFVVSVRSEYKLLRWIYEKLY